MAYQIRNSYILVQVWVFIRIEWNEFFMDQGPELEVARALQFIILGSNGLV